MYARRARSTTTKTEAATAMSDKQAPITMALLLLETETPPKQLVTWSNLQFVLIDSLTAARMKATDDHR